MRAELHVGRRYLAGLRRRTHVSTVTLISLAGLGLGVMALIVTLSLLEGFQSSIRRELVGQAGHARVRPAQGRRLVSADALASELQKALGDVETVKVVSGSGIVTSLTDAVPASIVGRSDVVDAAVNRMLAAQSAIGTGDVIQVISPRQRLTPMGPLPIRSRLQVAEVRPPGPGVELAEVILPLGEAQRLLWGQPVVDAIELRDPADPWGLGARVRELLSDRDHIYEVQGLEDLHRPLLLALTLERVVIFAAVGLMLVVAALNLLCNVAMIAAEKRQDLAVLAGLGMTPVSLRRLFLVLGVGVGLAGAVTGAVFGVGLSLILDLTQALPLPRGVFVVSSVPFRVQPVAVAAVMTLALALALGASWLPARAVARREPADGLRYE